MTLGIITWNCTNAVIDMDRSRNDVVLLIAFLFHVAAVDVDAYGFR